MHQGLFRFKGAPIQAGIAIACSSAVVPRYRIAEHGQDRTYARPRSTRCAAARSTASTTPLHDLLMRARRRRRPGARDQAGRARRPVPPRPRGGDPASRLLARHDGAAAARRRGAVWREIIAASTRLQGPFRVRLRAGGAEHALRSGARAFRRADAAAADELRRAGVGAPSADGHAAGRRAAAAGGDARRAWWRGFGGAGGDAPCDHRAAALRGDVRSSRPRWSSARQAFEATGEDRGYLVSRPTRRSAARGCRRPWKPRASSRSASRRRSASPTAAAVPARPCWSRPTPMPGPTTSGSRPCWRRPAKAFCGLRSIGGYAVPLALRRRRRK